MKSEDSQQQPIPEYSQQGKLQNQELTEQMQMSNQIIQAKIMQIQNKFKEAYRQFREDRQNIFVIQDPSFIQIVMLLKMWDQRPTRTQKFIMHLQLVNSKMPFQKIKETFQLRPSIKLLVNGIKIENNSILFSEGDYFYEGIQKSMTITSEVNESMYSGETKDMKAHGLGMFLSRNKKNGFRYEGQFVNGKLQGHGEWKNNKHMNYIGEFKNDWKHGMGIETQYKKKKNPVQGEFPFLVKSVYDGEFKEGDRNGKGIEKSNHMTYDGQWKGNVKCGIGIVTYKNGDSYNGSWQNNEFSGEGQYIQKGNSTYKGGFIAGKYHGKGVMDYENGDRYEGDYVNNKKQGNGIYTWADGDYYDGEWKNDSAEGHGTSMLGTDFYDGEFKNGKRHGLGELTNEEGDVIKAIWENNEIKKVIERNGQSADE